MEIEIKDISHGEADEGKTFDHHCVLAVKTTDDDDNVTETKEQGYMIQGKDCVYLNTPKIYPSQKDQRLMTDAQDIVGAINELFMLEPEGDDWQPPPWWIPVPEPKPYEIFILVWVESTAKSFYLQFVNKETGSSGGGGMSVDWGDGTTTNIPANVWWGGHISHDFTETGQYLVKITATDELNVLYAIAPSAFTGCCCQIIKTGSNILFRDDYHDEHGYTNTPFAMHDRLKYIKINNTKGLPIDKTQNYYFEYAYALQKIELKKRQILRNIPEYCFDYNCSLKDFSSASSRAPFDCNSVTSVGRCAFRSCHELRKIFLPNCTSVGDDAFYECFNLQEAVFAEGCTFGKNCFHRCYSLFPRPDGSVDLT